MMFVHSSLFTLILIFVVSVIIVWVAGIYLSKTTDVLTIRLGLGEALGGMILLAIITNLPEIAITISGSLTGHLDMVTGNLLGGIAIQTVVLVLFDMFGMKKGIGLTYQAASLNIVLEALLVMAVLSVCIMAAQLPANLTLGNIAPGGVLITILWLVGIGLIGRSQNKLPWQQQGDAPYGQSEQKGHSKDKKNQKANEKNISTKQAVIVFFICAIATLVCGVLLEKTGEELANRFGMSGVVFGAVVLAAATSIPELSTGLASIKMNDYKLAMSDIFGGNAFLPVLFLLASLISGKAVLPMAHKSDLYLTALGIILTAIYACGLIFRPKKQYMYMSIDSLLVLIIYIVGIIGLMWVG